MAISSLPAGTWHSRIPPPGDIRAFNVYRAERAQTDHTTVQNIPGLFWNNGASIINPDPEVASP